MPGGSTVTDLPAIDVLLTHTRSRLDRVLPERPAEELAGAILSESDPSSDARGTVTCPVPSWSTANVLEWRLDPTSPPAAYRDDRLGCQELVHRPPGQGTQPGQRLMRAIL